MYQKRLACGLVSALASVGVIGGNVAKLTDENFDVFVKDDGMALVKFYAPWCGHCKSLAPEFENAATTLMEKEIRLGEVDCTEQQELCKDHKIEGYPTLKIFRGQDIITPYDGPRNADGIVSYMVKQSLPPVSALSKDTLDDFKTSDNVVLVAYFAADDKASNATFTSVAESLRNEFLFGGVHDADLAKAEGVKLPGVVAYRKFDDPKSVYDGKFEVEALKDFVKMIAIPLVGEIGPETYNMYMESQKPLVHIFAETLEERTKLANALKPVAKKYKGKYHFGTVDASKFGAHAGNLNLKADKFPSFVVHEIARDRKFVFDQDKEVNYENIDQFMDDYDNGNIEHSVKSEPIPEKQEGPVFVAVAKTYQELVGDEKKDVLLEFYAPWCGHCKALAPKYEELASLYAGDEYKNKVVVAKIDATLNDVEEKIEGFPTIMLFPAKKGAEGIVYDGDRSVEGLAKFIQTKGAHKVDALKDATGDVSDDKQETKKKTKAKGKEDKEDKKEAKAKKDKKEDKKDAKAKKDKKEEKREADEYDDPHDEL